MQNEREMMTPNEITTASFICADGAGAVSLTVPGATQLNMTPKAALTLCAKLLMATAGAARGLEGVTNATDADINALILSIGPLQSIWFHEADEQLAAREKDNPTQ